MLLQPHNEQHGVVGEARWETPTTTPSQLALNQHTSTSVWGSCDQSLNHPTGALENAAGRTAGEKRQTTDQHHFELASNKRHCNDATKNPQHKAGANFGTTNPRKRPGIGAIVEADSRQYGSLVTCATASKRAKTDGCSEMEDTDEDDMVICNDENKSIPNDFDAANDVWACIGIG